MLCYFFCTQEIFGSVAPDVQGGYRYLGGYETPGFTGLIVKCSSVMVPGTWYHIRFPGIMVLDYLSLSTWYHYTVHIYLYLGQCLVPGTRYLSLQWEHWCIHHTGSCSYAGAPATERTNHKRGR